MGMGETHVSILPCKMTSVSTLALLAIPYQAKKAVFRQCTPICCFISSDKLVIWHFDKRLSYHGSGCPISLMILQSKIACVATRAFLAFGYDISLTLQTDTASISLCVKISTMYHVFRFSRTPRKLPSVYMGKAYSRL